MRCCGQCTSWLPPPWSGNIDTRNILPKGYEFILTEGDESELTKGFESHAPSPLEAAGCKDLLCRQLDTYVHHGELRYATMDLIVFSFSASAEREIVSDANEKSSYIDVSYDTKRKLMTKMDMKETFGLPDRNPTTSTLYARNDWAVVRRNVFNVDGKCRNEKRCYIALV